MAIFKTKPKIFLVTTNHIPLQLHYKGSITRTLS